MIHKLPVRIYYEDTDAGGVVYHANYLNFAERGRTEFLRNLGHENSALEKEYGTLFVVRHIEIDYLKPAFLDDDLYVQTSISELKNTSFVMDQRVFRTIPNQDGVIISAMKVALVCVDTNTIKPVRLPDVIQAQFKKYVTG